MPFDFWSAFVAALMAHIFNALKLYSIDENGQRKYWMKELPIHNEEDNTIEIKFTVPLQDGLAWLEANNRRGFENFLSPKEWNDNISGNG